MHAKVAAYANGRVILNKGSNAGVLTGMRFAGDSSKNEIKDPDTGAVLGYHGKRMPHLLVELVHEKMSECVLETDGTVDGYQIGDEVTDDV